MILKMKRGDARAELIAVLQAARRLLTRPGNEFMWSGWKNGDEALREVDALINRISTGDLPARLDVSVLFAPTGPIQEVSISSGWAQTFLALGDRFDAVERRLWPETSRQPLPAPLATDGDASGHHHD